MANSVQILAKIARDAAQLGLTVNSQTATAVVIENGANDITVGYVTASIQAPMGGVDSSVSPYLGIGTANPGKISITCADAALSATGMKVLALCAGFANNLSVSLNSVVTEIRGHADLIGMGQ